MQTRKVELTPTMYKILRLLDCWGGDISSDFEEHTGCAGAVLKSVLNALVKRGVVTIGDMGTYPLTELGVELLKERSQ